MDAMRTLKAHNNHLNKRLKETRELNAKMHKALRAAHSRVVQLEALVRSRETRLKLCEDRDLVQAFDAHDELLAEMEAKLELAESRVTNAGYAIILAIATVARDPAVTDTLWVSSGCTLVDYLHTIIADIEHDENLAYDAGQGCYTGPEMVEVVRAIAEQANKEETNA